MAVHATDELLLLRTIIPIVLEVTTFYTGESEQAVEARKRLTQKNRDPSYAAIHTDLKSFEATLRTVPEQLADASEADLKSITDVLSVIEEKILVDTEGERETYEYEEPDDYPALCFLLAQLNDDKSAPPTAQRVGWLIKKFKLEHPRQESRKRLVAAVGLCHQAIKTYAEATVKDISWAPKDGKQAEWDGARSIYAEAESLHDALKHSWDCRCGEQHRATKFAFDLSAKHEQGSLGCTVFYPNTPNWLPARLHYRAGNSGDTLKPTMIELTPGRRRRSSQQRPSRISSPAPQGVSHICNLLRSMAAGGCLGISDSAVWLRQDDGSYDVELFGSPTRRDIALQSWSELVKGHDLHFSKSKHRLTLALILSYAYLHLGGGPWWPYQRGEDNVYLYLTPDANGKLMKFPFFAPSLLQSPDEIEAPMLLKMFNQHMPSLPAFGKLLFELVLGRGVDWNNIEKEMRAFEDESHADDLLPAVKVCTGFGDDKTFTSGGRIRDDERLRMHFVNEVVLKIQHVLDVAYRVNVKDIFDMPQTEPQLSKVLSVSDCGSSVRSVSLDPPTIDLNGFCLHDGHDPEELQDTDVQSADKWMTDMEAFVAKTYGRGLASDPADDPTPVKIAVIDTGAAISRQDIGDLFEHRLIECRSWLNTTEAEGILLFDVEDKQCGVNGGIDADGHGTHATSTLLGATNGTNIEVFVAQVFESRNEKLRNETNGDQKTADAIAKAIRYAVDVWGVDVISMSFGFPHIDSGIENAIDHAYHKKVLMLAAASNCGGSKKPSWPARCPHVMCIHATTGLGNKYPKNPTPWKRENNFAVLGCSVEALWLPLPSGEKQYAHKSGTSTATPIAAGLAGVIMSVMRRSKAAYINTRSDRRAKQQARSIYDSKLQALGRPDGMGKVFRLMVEEEEEARDGYTYLEPLKMVPANLDYTYMVQTMLARLPD